MLYWPCNILYGISVFQSRFQNHIKTPVQWYIGTWYDVYMVTAESKHLLVSSIGNVTDHMKYLFF